MSKTVPFDLLASLIVGMAIPLLCPERVRTAGSALLNRYLLGVALFEILFFIPLGAYLYYFYPDWSLMFFVDPAGLEPATVRNLGLVFLAAYLAAALAGFGLGSTLIRARRAREAWGLFIVLIVGLGVFSFLTLGRLMNVGSYADWSAAVPATTPLVGHLIGYVIAVDSIFAAAALSLMIASFRRHSPLEPSGPST